MTGYWSRKRLASLLGWLGVLPFVGLSAAACLVPQLLPFSARAALSAYALAIISFLAGAWWGMALIRARVGLLLASNVVVVCAWMGFFLMPHGFPLLATLLLWLLYIVEQRHPMFLPQPAYYIRLRVSLTLVASLALLSVRLAAPA